MQPTYNRQLLCTFSTNKKFQRDAENIKKFYEIHSNRIFAFSNMRKDISKFPSTILIHRKKEFNILYTLNSMNRLIEEENGSRDTKYILDWKLYANSLIITGEISVRIIPLTIHDVLD